MSALTIVKHQDQFVVDSREVAIMVDRPHNDLMKSIRQYCDYLGQGDFTQSDFFIESTYTNSQNKEQPCYLLTRKGCDMVANKMTGEKGVLFTAAYVTKFEEMERQIKAPAPLSPAEALLQSVQLLAEQERRLATHDQEIATIQESLQVANHRLDSLDMVNIEGTARQRLNAMVKKYAWQTGIGFNKAWDEFKKRFNLAYSANLELLITNYEHKTGLKATAPQYLAAVNRLEDGIRVADKMINQKGA